MAHVLRKAVGVHTDFGVPVNAELRRLDLIRIGGQVD
jgi:hypothetical protein